ncbi:rhodanese-like domain-containing protein 3 [Elsinoe australis]|uniref:Rhodanese-like domain-containing protein 3 n=1 Tax=Elsinoe australis TaxID=40998 RepID=A0A4V6YAU9_9PEZI|nr:rhodanese-like domain-containing protein 3 [Elsinoe australis]
MPSSSQQNPEPAWHEAFPKPNNTSPEIITHEELLRKFEEGQRPGKDYLLVDVRRNDHEGGTIHTSLNLPAQTLFHSLDTLASICTNAQIPLVIFYCGSSCGRGPRAAGWFDDFLQDHKLINTRSIILEGGIKGWAKAGKPFTDFMDGFDASKWSDGS